MTASDIAADDNAPARRGGKTGKKARPRRSNRERRAESDGRIIQAALDLFAERGYQQTSLIQIGKRAGYTGTLVSNRFGSKPALLRVVMSTILNRFQDDEKQSRAMMRAPAAADAAGEHHDAAQLMRDFVRDYVDDALQNPVRLRALYVLMGEGLGNLPEIQDDLKRVNQVFRRHIEGLVQYGMDRGEFAADLSAPMQATIIVGTMRGVAAQLFAEPGRTDRDQLVRALQQSVVRPLLKP